MVSLADILVTQKSKGATRLGKIDALINWSRFGYRLEKILVRSTDGRPLYPALSMFKAMILQRLYNFSDPEKEAQNRSRIRGHTNLDYRANPFAEGSKYLFSRINSFDIVPIWINNKSCVISIFILRPKARFTIAFPVISKCTMIECINSFFARSIKG